MNISQLNIDKLNNMKAKFKLLYQNKKIKVIFFLLICIVTVCMIYRLNESTQLVCDDYRYHYIYENCMPTDNVQRIKGFTDIIKSMYNHYNMWGGRIVAHSLVQFFLMYNKSVFNVANSITFVLLALLIYLHCNGFKKIKCTLLIIIIILLWFFIPMFGETVLWISGAFNYLWCTLIILTFLLPYRLYIEENRFVKDNFISIVLMFLFGIIAGWTNENTGGAMILLQMLFILYYIFIKRVIPKWSISGLLGSIIGFIFLVIAPGNYVRSEHDIKIKMNLISRLKFIILNSSQLIWGLIIILAILTIILINHNKNTDKKIKIFVVPLIYVISALAGIAALILSPEAPQRTWFGPIIFIIVSIGYIYSKIDFNNIMLKQILIACIFLFSVSFFINYMTAYMDIKTTNFQIIEQVEVIKKEKILGDREITIKNISKPLSTYNAFYNLGFINKDKKSWMNRWVAKYYEVDSITGETR